jgi:hypothetical protein
MVAMVGTWLKNALTGDVPLPRQASDNEEHSIGSAHAGEWAGAPERSA